MYATNLHHLAVPCLVDIKENDQSLCEENKDYFLNPEAIIRYEPEGAVITPPMLYSSFLFVDDELSNLLRSGKISSKGMPTYILSALLENKVILPAQVFGRKNREMKVELGGLPTQVLLDVTSFCPCDCITCYHKFDLDGYVPPLASVFARINKLKELGVGLFEITGGEPFSRPDLELILKYLKAIDLSYYVVTNGEFLYDLTGSMVSLLVDSLGIAVSLDGIGPIHDSVRHRVGLYDKMIKGVDRLYSEGVKIYFITTLNQENIGDAEAMIEVAQKYETTVHFRPTINTGAAALNKLERIDVAKKLESFLKHPNVRNGLLSTKKIIAGARYYGCGIRKRISVDSRGNLYPCVMDRTRYSGNIESYSQKTLVSELEIETREMLQQNIHCRDCKYNEKEISCGGFCRFSQSAKFKPIGMKEKKKYDNSGAYHIMAQYYDRLMGENKYIGWRSLIAKVVNEYQIPKDLSLDVACGTGNISKILIDLGFKVRGVDLSVEMVSIAQQKFPSEKFICADSRKFELFEDQGAIDFAVSFYDSLNYLLTDDAILDTFKSVNASLKSGAIFLFDMNPMGHIEIAQKFKPRVFEEGDFYTVFRFGGEDRFWTLNVDFFIKEKDNHYRLITEEHIERGYNEDHIRPLLKQAGFRLLDVKKEYKIYEDNKEHLSRLYFIAKKV